MNRNNKMLAPICLFTYNRLWETKQTVEALKNNYLASECELIIFSDGAKNKTETDKINEVRQYLKTINGFKSVTIYESPINQGLSVSIISGVTKVIQQYGKIIVLEDDLITSKNFLNYMNQALDFYVNNPMVHSISAYTLDLPTLKDYEKDYYLGYRSSSWGWGTWIGKWNTTDWKVEQYKKFIRNPIKIFKFMRGGSDMPFMLNSQIKGRIDSWAIRWCFDQFLKEQLTVFPSSSKVVSIGFGENATHTKKTKRFNTILENGIKRDFIFSDELMVNKKLMKEFRNKFSFYNRIKDKF